MKRRWPFFVGWFVCTVPVFAAFLPYENVFAVQADHIEAAESTESVSARFVPDGDSLTLTDGTEIRLIGIDSPEIKDKDGRNAANASHAGLDAKAYAEYAIRAREFARAWVKDQTLRLEMDPANESISHLDKYGRMLAYVYRASDGACLNKALVEEGLAMVYRRFEFRSKDSYLASEKLARDAKRGFWSAATE